LYLSIEKIDSRGIFEGLGIIEAKKRKIGFVRGELKIDN